MAAVAVKSCSVSVLVFSVSACKDLLQIDVPCQLLRLILSIEFRIPETEAFPHKTNQNKNEDAMLARVFHQFRSEIADSQTGLALEKALSEATSRQVVATKRSRKRQERSAQTSEAAIATEI